MRTSTAIICILFLVACQQEKSVAPLTQKQAIKQPKPTWEQTLKRLYDIPELESYNDSTQIIRLFTINKRYNHLIAIEMSEYGNSVCLCVKVPRFAFDINHPPATRRLPFNQLCYSYEGTEAQEIRDWFKPFDSGRIVDSVECRGCLDPEIWTVEVFNHGKYSFFVKDAYGINPPVVENLLKKVNLNKKNNYSLVY